MSFVAGDFHYMPESERERAAMQVNSGVQDACFGMRNQDEPIPAFNSNVAGVIIDTFSPKE